MVESIKNFYQTQIATLDLIGWITIVSFFITIVGFAITFLNISKTKQLIKKSNNFVLTLNKVSEMEQILYILEELKEYNRKDSPQLKLYAFVRNHFIEFKEFIPKEQIKFHTYLQSLITFLKDCENIIEKSAKENKEINYIVINQKITKHSIQIKEITANLKKGLEKKYE